MSDFDLHWIREDNYNDELERQQEWESDEIACCTLSEGTIWTSLRSCPRDGASASSKALVTGANSFVYLSRAAAGSRSKKDVKSSVCT